MDWDPVGFLSTSYLQMKKLLRSTSSHNALTVAINVSPTLQCDIEDWFPVPKTHLLGK